MMVISQSCCIKVNLKEKTNCDVTISTFFSVQKVGTPSLQNKNII